MKVLPVSPPVSPPPPFSVSLIAVRVGPPPSIPDAQGGAQLESEVMEPAPGCHAGAPCNTGADSLDDIRATVLRLQYALDLEQYMHARDLKEMQEVSIVDGLV